jgi:NAD(P)-dependent dehydrogenase (short-subunit alcohol dehydrogenase family)
VSRVALVTGATSGIGRAAALALSEAGWWTMVAGRDEERARQAAAELKGDGAYATVELADDDGPRRLVERTIEEGGGLDVLVNNAGIHSLATVAELTDDDLDALLAVNLRAAIRLAGLAVRHMREAGGGVVVNVASEAGLVAVPGQVAYNVTKAGLVMLTRSIAVDHAADGIRSVAICPGTTRTPLVDRAIASAPDPGAHERALAETRPARRLGTPEEIAAAIAFAASEEASFMTGTEIVVDGGYTAV